MLAMLKYLLLLALVVAVSTKPCKLTGINLSSGEANSGEIPGNYGYRYIYPSNSNADYFINKGMNVFRVPFILERIQKYPGGPLIQSELTRYDSLINYITVTKEKYVLLDPHNYGSAFRGKVGESATPHSVFADFWFKLAQHYADNPRIIFGLMNEPNGQSSAVWCLAAQSAVYAIRNAGAGQLILVPGTRWTGAHSWISSNSGFNMLNLTDPADNFAFELHQYLDSDSSGTHDTCTSETIGVSRLSVFTNWAKANGKRGFLGEFGGGRDTECGNAISNAITHMEDNDDVWLGWTYWAGGPWWPDDYFSVLQPNKTGLDREQWRYIAPHVNQAAVTLPNPNVDNLARPDHPEIVMKSTYVYNDDLVAPFKDYGWAKPKNKFNSTYKYAGQYSYEFTLDSAYAAVRFSCPTTGCFNNSAREFLTLSFYFMSPTGNTGVNKISIDMLDADNKELSGSRGLSAVLTKTPAPFEWVLGVIPVTAFEKVQVYSIQFSSSSSTGDLPVMFLDEITLVNYDDSFQVVMPGGASTSSTTSRTSSSSSTTSRTSSSSSSSATTRTSSSSSSSPSSSSSSSASTRTSSTSASSSSTRTSTSGSTSSSPSSSTTSPSPSSSSSTSPASSTSADSTSSPSTSSPSASPSSTTAEMESSASFISFSFGLLIVLACLSA